MNYSICKRASYSLNIERLIYFLIVTTGVTILTDSFIELIGATMIIAGSLLIIESELRDTVF